jgi:hypothetical protein
VAIARSPASRPQVAVIMTRRRSSDDANPWAGICCIAKTDGLPGFFRCAGRPVRSTSAAKRYSATLGGQRSQNREACVSEGPANGRSDADVNWLAAQSRPAGTRRWNGAVLK